MGGPENPRSMVIDGLLARCTFPPAGTAVVCAVSGGPDSTAMLALAAAAGRDVAVIEAACRRFGAELRCVAAPVQPGGNLEERARVARHAALPAGALLGHTADDQAETVLLQVLRGTGLHGLAGMPAEHRPILALRRAETHRLCVDLGLDTVADPLNLDPALRRNRVRHELLPLLDDIAQRDVVPLLTRLAGIARESTEHLDAEAAELDVLDAATLRGAPPVLARLAIRAWLAPLDDHRHPPDAATIERVLDVARLDLGATDVGGGWQVRRTAGRLRLVRPADGG
jgi:tRNA(Ile)-lysidine synthase